MTDITPHAPQGTLLIERCGHGRFALNGEEWTGSIALFGNKVTNWPGESLPDRLDQLAGLGIEDSPPQILLLGAGERSLAPPSPSLRASLSAQGCMLECMPTRAACRTYNVLAVEGRLVAAVLLAV